VTLFTSGRSRDRPSLFVVHQPFGTLLAGPMTTMRKQSQNLSSSKGQSALQDAPAALCLRQSVKKQVGSRGCLIKLYITCPFYNANIRGRSRTVVDSAASQEIVQLFSRRHALQNTDTSMALCLFRVRVADRISIGFEADRRSRGKWGFPQARKTQRGRKIHL
jgi:hypothetical protein